ncbi:MAG: hypothetical protein F2813_03070 [Actinobacteria bacterium]|uniref:Unannotated protein n=1 Tax=freshwater metagenome TaxID=449393 RepID=A0A6J5ZG84_9ZZZZ|nr:hypothetical protein [Actinomycetota bacterium]
MRITLLIVVFLFLLAFFAGTVMTIAREGINVLSVLSLLLIGLMAIGIFGALAEGADRDE